jgi:uncharacterized membrane protein YfcA
MFTEALATPGLGFLALTIFGAGLVRGFSGFGTALVFMPVATLFVPVSTAIVVVTLAGMATWGLIVPRAWREAERGEVGVLALAAIALAPLGVWILTWADETALRWGVAAVATCTLAALVSGWRFRGRLGWPGLGAIGSVAGVLGGTTGLAGPPVILFYLAGPSGAAKVRANTILFLAALDIGILVNLLARGLVGWSDGALAVVLTLPYGIGLVAGQAAFRPDAERLFRGVAYGVIALAIVSGLPLFH